MINACAQPVRMLNGPVGEIEGYIAIWGSPDERDAYGTWFDRARPPYMALENGMHRRPILYEHGQDPVVGKDVIGFIEEIEFDDVGIRYRGALDRSSPHFARVAAEIQRGELATSSGTMSHLAEFYDDGAFKTWPLGELSLTKSPAETRMPSTVLLRSAEGMREASCAAKGADKQDEREEDKKGNRAMNEQLMQALNDLMSAGFTAEDILNALQAVDPAVVEAAMMPDLAPEIQDEGVQPEEPEVKEEAMDEDEKKDAAAKALEALIAQLGKPRSAAKARPAYSAPKRNPFDRPAPIRANVQVGEPRAYLGKSADDLLLADQIMRAYRIEPSEQFLRIRNMRAAQAVEREIGVFADPAVRSMMPFTRANEVATTTATAGGLEWVSTAWSTSIWEKARHARIMEQLIERGMRVEEVPQGSSGIYVLTEGADPTVYTLSENPDLDSTNRPSVNVGVSRIGTGRVLVTPGELGMAVVWTDVLDEDSIIAVSSQYQRQIAERAEEVVEQLFINGDTATAANTNINLIDGTPGTGLNRPYYLASDGALKYALVTGTNTSRDGGTLDEDDYLHTWKLLPTVVQAQRDRIAFVVDPDTYAQTLRIPAIKTDDVRAAGGTLSTGMVTPVYGIDVFMSGFMELANATGKVSGTASNNTKGRILAVYAPYWAMAWKRRITVETDRDILAGANIIVAKMRVGFAPRGAGASTVSYNLTV